MTSLFDGLAGLLNDVFGDPVIWTPSGGAPVTIRAVFRQQPVEVASDQGGTVLISDAVLRVQKTAGSGMVAGDIVTLSDGRSFRIESRIPGESPASDGFLIFTLEVME